jgi:2'-5' RNA ligase
MTVSSDTERYFIACVPPPPIFDQVTEFKEYFERHFQSKASLNSPPHITLHMPFEWKVKSNETLIASLETFFKNEKPVQIHLKNFGSFPPRVIFVDVRDAPGLAAMQKRLTQHCKRNLNLFNADYQDRPFHAHMTIAFRDLKKAAFASAWKEFQSKHFDGEFHTRQISLLKHSGGKWEIFRDFDLLGD